MAWNQPGQNNPWGGRRPGGQGNGPDLDERVKSWQRRLESLFRPGGGRGSEGRSALILVAVVALVIWLASGIFQIKAAEQGVILRFGKLVDIRNQGPGWRWPWPIEQLVKVNVASIQSSEYKSRVLTSDVNLVELRFAVQYQLSDPKKVLFQVKDPEATLSEVSEMAIREVVGRSELDNVLVGKTRPEITRRAKELIQRTLDAYNTGITITTVNLTDVQVPEPVIPSQRDANKALADQERFVKESQAYANSIIPVAQGAAARMQQDAEAYKSQVTALAEGQTSRFLQLESAYAQAPDVTRKRLYMDTIENVLARAHKVLIDTKAGNGAGGNMLYLPLDKLLERANSRDDSGQTTVITGRDENGGNSSPKQQEPDSVTVEARGRGDR
jgi:membrane protease subunit HflK